MVENPKGDSAGHTQKSKHGRSILRWVSHRSSPCRRGWSRSLYALSCSPGDCASSGFLCYRGSNKNGHVPCYLISCVPSVLLADRAGKGGYQSTQGSAKRKTTYIVRHSNEEEMTLYQLCPEMRFSCRKMSLFASAKLSYFTGLSPKIQRNLQMPFPQECRMQTSHTIW